ncbi:MAG: T9SS type A sorting domain-containing protein [Crocinitomicaceae bacterium]|nr:T9SS type A sorting domain-containing protein [Crocinitomicaceae bacterium]
MKKLITLLFLIVLNTSVFGQRYFELMADPKVPLDTIYNAFIEHANGQELTEVKGYKQFMRWYSRAEKIAYPNATLEKYFSELNDRAYERLLQGYHQNRIGGPWISLGPTEAPINGNVGRVDGIAVHPLSNDTIYIAHNSGGLWRTFDAGLNWENLTDYFPLAGISTVSYSISNPQVMYCGTSYDYNLGSNNLGLFKSTDGGDTWSLTNFNFQTYPSTSIKVILVHPTDENIIYISATSGIYKSIDGGINWNQVSTNSPREMVFKPGDPQTIYAAGNNINYTNDGGSNWTSSTGLPVPDYNSYTIAVTADDPNYVYVVRTFSANFGGAYRSVDSGVSFTLQANTPNILGSTLTGTGPGQGAYCLGMACDPTDKDRLFAGGINLWTSADGGVTWYTDMDIISTHADVQELKFFNGYLYVGNDGGLFRTNDNGSTWDTFDKLQSGLIYKISHSEQVPGTILTGWQDNGTADFENGEWEKIFGGDGMTNIIDYSDNLFRVISYQNGYFYSTSDGVNYSPKVSTGGSGVNESGYFDCMMQQDRTDPNNFYVGKSTIYKSTDKCNHWTALAPIPYTTLWNKISTFDVCQTNANYIYAESVGEIFRTDDGGNSWSNITTGVDVDSAYIAKIKVSPVDSSHVWVAMSGSNEFTKVYESTDFGNTWTNISSGLPNMPVEDLLIQKGTNNRIYVSTAEGVFTRDDVSPVWELYGTNLPKVAIQQMVMDYENSTLYASTYGRAIWYNELILETVAPTAAARFYHQKECGLENGTVVVVDVSENSPTQWEWSFPGGNPSTSSMPSPTVYYATTGAYNAQLITTNDYGTDTVDYVLNVINSQLPQAIAVNTLETFEASSLPPVDLSLFNPSSNQGWEVSTTTGAYSISDHCFVMDNYNNGFSNDSDWFELLPYDMTSLTWATLSFDVSTKAKDASHIDTLQVLVSIDCGITWTQVFEKTSNELFVGTQYDANLFVPAAADWQSMNINLNSYSGSPRVAIKILNISGQGNTLYIDNINVAGSNPYPPVALYDATATEICVGDSIQYQDQSINFPNSREWNFEGGTPSASVSMNETVTYNTSGTYNVKLISSNFNGSDTLEQIDILNVYDIPLVPVISVNAGTLSTIAGYSYEWYWDNDALSVQDTNNICVTQPGYYHVVITDGHGCKNSSSEVYVEILRIGENQISFLVFPNPTNGTIYVTTQQPLQEDYLVSVSGVDGKLVKQQLSFAKGSNMIQIDLEDLSGGIYFLHLTDKKGNHLKDLEILLQKP